MIVFCVLDQLLPVHHKNIYPTLSGSYNQNVQLSTVYVLGFLASFVHQFKLYVILYPTIFHFAFNVISPVISNAICLIISTMFFLIYLFFFSKKIITKFLFYIILLILIETIIIFISLYVINLGLFGIILIVMNSLMFIAPGQNIMRVIKEKNYKLIPIATTLVAIICSGGWLLFGILVNDINCIISNLIGLVSSIFTTLIWVIYYLRSKIARNKNKFYQEENIDNKNVEIR